MKPYVVLRLQGERSGRRARSGLRGPPQLATHGPEEPLRLLPAPRGLLLAGPAGRALHPAAARKQEEATAPDAGRRGAVQTPPAGQEEEGQCAAAGHAQPRDIGLEELLKEWRVQTVVGSFICHAQEEEDEEEDRAI